MWQPFDLELIVGIGYARSKLVSPAQLTKGLLHPRENEQRLELEAGVNNEKKLKK